MTAQSPSEESLKKAREIAHKLINKWQRIHEHHEIRGFFDLRDYVAEAILDSRPEPAAWVSEEDAMVALTVSPEYRTPLGQAYAEGVEQCYRWLTSRRDAEINRLTYELDKSRDSHMKRIEKLERENARLKQRMQQAYDYLRQGKAEFSPHTTNSHVDVWLADYEQALKGGGDD